MKANHASKAKNSRQDIPVSGAHLSRIEKKLDRVLNSISPWMSKREFYSAERMSPGQLEKLIAAQAWEQGEIPEFKPRPGGRNLYCSTKDYTAWLDRREKRGRV